MAFPRIPRRTFLETIVISAGAVTLARVTGGCGDDVAGGDPAVVFPQSVASGDPRQDSIVLWTRVQPSDLGADASVRLEVSPDEAFGSLVSLDLEDLMAEAAHDHCVRVKVTGLTAATRYYYRFVYDGTRSRVGRFRTAAAPGADVPVRFAVASCQDYTGRYYNSYLKLLEPEQDDLEFVVHLGDYVYETTGDPGFMSTEGDRRVTLTDTAGAIPLSRGGETFYAAQSLDNYRELYRTFRTDPILQRVHELFPFIVIWDDHEFADDSWQDVATHFTGLRDERGTERRRNSEQAFFEYQPVAMDTEGAGAIPVDRAQLFPNTRLYRDLRFGQNAHLVLTDYRSFRPDHYIPESAWPGQVVMTQAEVITALEALYEMAAGDMFDEGEYRPYVMLSEAEYADHQEAAQILLAAAYEAAGAAAELAGTLADEAVSGGADAELLNALIDAGRASLPIALQGLEAIEVEALPRGLPYFLFGKRDLFTSVGSRYLVVQSHYDLWAAHLHAADQVTHPLGDAQLAFVESAIAQNDDATWTVFASSVSFTPLVLDLRDFVALLPAGFSPGPYYLNADQWDGFPVYKERLLEEVLRPRNALMLAGDIHAAFVTDHGADAMGRRAVELTTPGISSGNFRSLLARNAEELPSLSGHPAVTILLGQLDTLLRSARPSIRHARTDVNGLILVSVDGTQMVSDLWQLLPAVVNESFYDRPEEITWQHKRYRVQRQGGVSSEIEDVTV